MTAVAIEPDLVRLVDVAAAAGISYRRADWWVRQGWVNVKAAEATYGHYPTPADYPGAPGSGYTRYIAPHEAHVLHLMARLTAAGITAEVASRAARALAMHPSIPTVSLAPGITVTIRELPPPTAPVTP